MIAIGTLETAREGERRRTTSASLERKGGQCFVSCTEVSQSNLFLMLNVLRTGALHGVVSIVLGRIVMNSLAMKKF